ncbi:hypothetical protein TQ33_0414 [Kangiella geojedonensis]|uniref:DUF4124 domain-containing protein n=2 Tax=Kangiella geojedonensis TaxID=914150 RepID=A0A0F6TPY6_9GAMM|nr:hypothetical protein TQ33_0414 [Kangiella geojedonensis]
MPLTLWMSNYCLSLWLCLLWVIYDKATIGTIAMITRCLAGSRTLLLLALSLVALQSPAKIYKWVDKDGNTHYSDKPPKDKRIKAKPQNLDNMNIIQMPRPVKTKALSNSQCQLAIDNFNKSFANHKNAIEKELAQGSIDDMQFAAKLTELESLKKQVTLKNCHKADPKLNTLLHCMAKNPNTQVCS